jgi:toxin ParE1/3/4
VTRSVVFALEAQDDLFQIYDHIATDAGAERARSYTDRIIVVCVGLATFPERGLRRADLRPGLRIVTFRWRVTVAFHITATTVTIDRIFDGGRDLKPLLGEDNIT